MAVVLEDGRFAGTALAVALAEVLERFPSAEAVAVDIPIGLPRRGSRAADLEARRCLGPRAASVFLTPPRRALAAPTYAEANDLCRRITGAGLSRQAYALRGRILEADAVAGTEGRLVEVHPEVSFRAMAGRPLSHSKRTWDGLEERRRLLAREGIHVPGRLPRAGSAAPDDVLDAAAAAWSAARVARGAARSLPASPPRDRRGRPVAIWY